MIRIFLCALCALCGSGCCTALDRTAFAFTNYDLNVRIEPGQQRLAVRGTITLRNDSSAPQKDASLQISSSLDWRSIRVGGKPVQFVSQPYTSDIDHTGALSEAIVSLPQALAPHASVELEIGYEGVIPLDATRLTRIGVPPDVAKHSDWDQIGKDFTAVRGIGYVAWYPIETDAANLSEGSSLFREIGRWKARAIDANFHSEICVQLPDDAPLQMPFLNLPTNGKAAAGVSKSEDGLGTHTSCLEYATDALGPALPTIVAGTQATLDSPEVLIHYFPEHKTQAETYATSVENVKAFVEQWFGKPRSAAQLFEQKDTDASPFESGNLLLLPLDSIDPNLAEMTAVHQLTHAAFPSPREWISEGVAHFAQALYEEHLSGRDAALKSMALQLGNVIKTEKSIATERAPNAAQRDSLINTPLEELYRSKAMYVWWMLRDLLGDAAFKRGLSKYQATDDRDPSYMQRLFESSSHHDLEWFFDDWVYRDRGLPDFRVDSVYPRKMLPKGYMLTVTVEDLGEAGAEVPVTVKTENGEFSKRLEVHGKSKASIRIETEAPPQQVIVNDGSVPETDPANNTFTVPQHMEQ